MNCSACNKPIGDDGDNELVITLEGGYGMFFDTDFTTKPDMYSLVLCHECAHKLVGSSSYLTNLLKGGHFHGFIYDLDGNLPQDNGGADCITDFHRNWGTL